MSYNCKTHPTHDSIFGDTYHGVPNPMVPHLHPYPTRYHGTILVDVEAGLPYVERPYAVPPYSGYGAADGSVSIPVVPIALGAAFAYIATDNKSQDSRVRWAALGGALAGIAGIWGVLGTGALILADRHAKG